MKQQFILLLSILFYGSCTKAPVRLDTQTTDYSAGARKGMGTMGLFGGEPMIGYATQNGGTTGGGTASSVTVSTYAALYNAAHASRDTARVIYVSGTITGTDQIYVGSNKTIIGLTGSVLDGVGLRLSTVHNVILQNLTIKNVVAELGSGDQDCITLKDSSHNVWVDHCDLSTPVQFVVNGDEGYYDGLLDISRTSSYTTVSWTKFSNSWKGSLVGLEDETGPKAYVTYHHCYFYNILERAPLVAYGMVHSFSNYFVNNTVTGHLGYSIDAFNGSEVRSENNYWDNTVTTTGGGTNLSTPIVTRDGTGYLTSVSTDSFIHCQPNYIPTSPGSFLPSYSYTAYLTPTADVPSVVMAGAGVYSTTTAPSITTQPVSQTVISGTNVTMSVVATGSPTLTYQWKKNGVNISGATSYFISGPVATWDSGHYTVVVTNANGSVTSSAAILTVTSTYQAEAGTLAGNAVVATSYSGYHGSGYVDFDTDASSFLLNNVTGNGGGTKTIRIRYSLGAGTSRAGTIVINGGTPIAITAVPTGAWTTWTTLDVSVTLNNNNTNTVKILTTTHDWGMVDEITIL